MNGDNLTITMGMISIVVLIEFWLLCNEWKTVI